MVAVALSIAGSDPSGGAGIQVDLKVFHAHGVFGEAAITLLTAQNSLGVHAVWPVPADHLALQLDALWDDMPPDALKTGAFSCEQAVEAVAERIRRRAAPLVVDPILGPTRGAQFAEPGLAHALRTQLIPLATLVTPNLDEARALTGLPIGGIDDALRAARALCRMGARAALVKGGHMEGDPVDVLCMEDGVERVFQAPRIQTRHSHGTGCVLSAAITARLARGEDLLGAIVAGRALLREALSAPPGLGAGRGPLNHFIVG